MTINKNIWIEFAKEINGKFIKREEGWLSDKTEVEFKDWKIYFDNYIITSGKFSRKMTRITAQINSNDGFRFKIYRSGIISKIETLFGGQDVLINRADFDDAFVIKANNDFKVKTLLQSQSIRNMIIAQKDFNLEISDEKGIWEGKLPEGELELIFFVDGEIENFDTLKSLLLLFQALLDELAQINAIKSNN